MDIKEIKKILKPLIKECIKEVLGDGMLSTIIAETMKATNIVVQHQQRAIPQQQVQNKKSLANVRDNLISEISDKQKEELKKLDENLKKNNPLVYQILNAPTFEDPRELPQQPKNPRLFEHYMNNQPQPELLEEPLHLRNQYSTQSSKEENINKRPDPNVNNMEKQIEGKIFNKAMEDMGLTPENPGVDLTSLFASKKGVKKLFDNIDFIKSTAAKK